MRWAERRKIQPQDMQQEILLVADVNVLVDIKLCANMLR